MDVENQNCDIIPIQIIVYGIFMGAENIGLTISLFDLYQKLSSGVDSSDIPRTEIYRLKDSICQFTKAEAHHLNLKNSFVTCLSQTLEQRQSTCPLARTCAMANLGTTIYPVDRRYSNTTPNGRRKNLQVTDVPYTYEPEIIYSALMERAANSDDPMASEAEQTTGQDAQKFLKIITSVYRIKSPQLAVEKLIANAKEKIPQVKAKFAKYLPEV